MPPKRKLPFSEKAYSDAIDALVKKDFDRLIQILKERELKDSPNIRRIYVATLAYADSQTILDILKLCQIPFVFNANSLGSIERGAFAAKTEAQITVSVLAKLKTSFLSPEEEQELCQTENKPICLLNFLNTLTPELFKNLLELYRPSAEVIFKNVLLGENSHLFIEKIVLSFYKYYFPILQSYLSEDFLSAQLQNKEYEKYAPWIQLLIDSMRGNDLQNEVESLTCKTPTPPVFLENDAPFLQALASPPQITPDFFTSALEQFNPSTYAIAEFFLNQPNGNALLNFLYPENIRKTLNEILPHRIHITRALIDIYHLDFVLITKLFIENEKTGCNKENENMCCFLADIYNYLIQSEIHYSTKTNFNELNTFSYIQQFQSYLVSEKNLEKTKKLDLLLKTLISTHMVAINSLSKQANAAPPVTQKIEDEPAPIFDLNKAYSNLEKTIREKNPTDLKKYLEQYKKHLKEILLFNDNLPLLLIAAESSDLEILKEIANRMRHKDFKKIRSLVLQILENKKASLEVRSIIDPSLSTPVLAPVKIIAPVESLVERCKKGELVAFMEACKTNNTGAIHAYMEDPDREISFTLQRAKKPKDRVTPLSHLVKGGYISTVHEFMSSGRIDWDFEPPYDDESYFKQIAWWKTTKSLQSLKDALKRRKSIEPHPIAPATPASSSSQAAIMAALPLVATPPMPPIPITPPLAPLQWGLPQSGSGDRSPLILFFPFTPDTKAFEPLDVQPPKP